MLLKGRTQSESFRQPCSILFNTYSDIIHSEQDRETTIKQLKDIGLEGFIRNDLSSKISFTDKSSLDISYKKWKFTDMFLFFIERRKATTIPNKR